MPREEQPQQSAYRCRSGRYGSNRYTSSRSPVKDSDEVNGCSNSNNDINDVKCDNRPKIDSTKLANDPFLGTVAGRLAQEIHDEFLVCKICLDSYTNPKCLTCLHTFCAECIEKHISAEVTYNKFTDYRDFTCPICRKRTQLPSAGVRKLPDNFLIAGLTDLVLRQKASTHYSSSNTITGCVNSQTNDPDFHVSKCSILSNESLDSLHQLPNMNGRAIRYGECEICAQVNVRNRGHSTEPSNVNRTLVDVSQRASSANLSTTPQATHKCLDCSKLLCTDCVQRHRLTKVTKDHALFQLQSPCDIECKEHAGETIRFFCEVCSTCICVLCTFNAHRDHEVTSFGEAVTKLRYDLSKNVELAFEHINCLQVQCQHINEAANLVHNIEQRIRTTTEHFIEEIQRQEQELISDLHQYIGQHNIETIANHSSQENQVELADIILRDVSNHLGGQDIDLLLAKKSLYDKLSEINEINMMELNLERFSHDIYFRSGSAHLGYLTHDPESENINEQFQELFTPLSCQSDSHNSSTSSSSMELAKRPCINSSACQTELTMSQMPDNMTCLDKKQYRSRACNTDTVPTDEKETNTRPRGIHTSITYSDIASNTTSEEYLSKLCPDQLNLDEMDNLTRARLRRKLHERHSTFDQPQHTGCNMASLTNGTTEHYNTRRYSNYERRY